MPRAPTRPLMSKQKWPRRKVPRWLVRCVSHQAIGSLIPPDVCFGAGRPPKDLISRRLSSPATGDRGFESISLHRRVRCEPDFVWFLRCGILIRPARHALPHPTRFQSATRMSAARGVMLSFGGGRRQVSVIKRGAPLSHEKDRNVGSSPLNPAQSILGASESAGFYQLPDSDKALHGDIPRVASGPDGRSGIRLPQAMAGLITPSSPA